jgi:hypothetical protein
MGGGPRGHGVGEGDWERAEEGIKGSEWSQKNEHGVIGRRLRTAIIAFVYKALSVG